MLDLYVAADGMNDGEMDSDLLRFWPVSELELLSSRADYPQPADGHSYLVFADWSIWAHFYGVRVGPGSAESSSPVVLVGGEDIVEVAPRFDAFLELYLSDILRIFAV